MSVYIHERIDIEGGGRGKFIELIRGAWAEHARERYAVRLAGVWATVGSTGNWPEVQLLWEMDDWEHFARARQAQYPLEDKDAFGTELWFQALEYRQRGTATLLEPAAAAPIPARPETRAELYLYEDVRSKPGALAAYHEALVREYLPVAESRGLSLFGAFRCALRPNTGINLWALRGGWDRWCLFRTADTSGPFPLVINIWEHTWRSQTAALERQFADASRNRAMEDWWNRNLHLRRGGYDRILIPSPYTLDAAALERAGVRGRVFLHEILWLPLGAADDYLAALDQQFMPLARRFDWQLVGAYRVSQRPRQVLALFALNGWSDLARLLAARAHDPELRRWLDYRDRIVEDLHELVLLPGRMNPLGIRD